MSDAITPARFHEMEGVEDWRVLGEGAYASFRTKSFAKGVALVDEIGKLADAANHHPDVDLRYGRVTVHLFTHDVMGLTERDAALARRISAAAHELSIDADPTGLRDIHLTIDALVSADVLPFWQAVLGYRKVGEDDLFDPDARWPSIWFQRMDAPRPQRNRMHVDVFVPHDQAEARIAAALAAGGRLVSDAHAPAWWTLADAEGNEADIATWMGRD
jgi:4a-hydroxytetrahydrobiopterin dehydratase